MEIKEDILILIVDDNLQDIRQIETLLCAYKTIVTTNFYEAILKAKTSKPDLIILEAYKPQINGFEICKALKIDTETKDIPVIFVTERNDINLIIKGFQCGAADHFSKPFEPIEFIAKINNQINLIKANKIINEQNVNLKKHIFEKNKIISIATHDLINPLKIVHGFTKLMEESLETFSENNFRDYIKDILDSTEAMFEILANVIEINALDQGNVEIFAEYLDVSMLINMIISENSECAYQKNIKINLYDNCKNEQIMSDFGKLRIILNHIISNSLKFSYFNKTINITLSKEEITADNKKYIRIIIADEGLGISNDDMLHIYDRFNKLSNKPTANEPTTGLGLAIVKILCDLLGIMIYCDSEVKKGTTFTLFVPYEINSYRTKSELI